MMEKVTFFPFRAACPICGEWLDCVTNSHTQKHGLTAREFVAKYQKIGHMLPQAPVRPLAEGENLATFVINTLSENPEMWISAPHMAQNMGIRHRLCANLLKQMEADGFLVSKHGHFVSRNACQCPSKRQVTYFKLKIEGEEEREDANESA